MLRRYIPRGQAVTEIALVVFYYYKEKNYREHVILGPFMQFCHCYVGHDFCRVN